MISIWRFLYDAFFVGSRAFDNDDDLEEFGAGYTWSSSFFNGTEEEETTFPVPKNSSSSSNSSNREPISVGAAVGPVLVVLGGENRTTESATLSSNVELCDVSSLEDDYVMVVSQNSESIVPLLDSRPNKLSWETVSCPSSASTFCEVSSVSSATSTMGNQFVAFPVAICGFRNGCFYHVTSKTWKQLPHHPNPTLAAAETQEPMSCAQKAKPENHCLDNNLRRGVAVGLGNFVYVIGGSYQWAHPSPTIQALHDCRSRRCFPRYVDAYNLQTGEWKIMDKCNMSEGRYECAAAAVASPLSKAHDQIVVLGGASTDDENTHEKVLSTAESFHIQTGRWASLPNMTTPRRDFAAASIGQYVLVFGGRTGRKKKHQHGENEREIDEITDSVQALDILHGGKWVDLPPMSTPRAGCLVMSVGTSVYVLGGYNYDAEGNKQYLTSMERFAPEHVSSPTPPKLPLTPTTLDPVQRAHALQTWIDNVHDVMQSHDITMQKAQDRIHCQYDRRLHALQETLEKMEDAIRLTNMQMKLLQQKRDDILDALKTNGKQWRQDAEDQIHVATIQRNLLRKNTSSSLPLSGLEGPSEDHLSSTSSFLPPPPQNPQYISAPPLEEEPPRYMASTGLEPLPNPNTTTKATAPSIATSSTPPSEIVCPITLEIMVDPVITTSGITYERRSIEEIFDRTPPNQQPICPVTNVPLSSRILIENVAVRALCREQQGQSQS